MASTSLVNVLAFFALTGATLAAQDIVPVKVAVYFESYCPDSVKFLVNQLYPAFTTPLSKYMNVTLVPYGKAQTSKNDAGEFTFTCSHGDKECYGDRVIACALHDTESTFADQFKFINCTSAHLVANVKQEEYPTKDCATVSSVKESYVKTCANETTSSNYLATYGDKTKEMFKDGPSNVPAIVFNEKFDAAENTLAQKDFRKALCMKITGTKPAECTKSAAPTLQSAVLPLLAAVVVISRL